MSDAKITGSRSPVLGHQGASARVEVGEGLSKTARSVEQLKNFDSQALEAYAEKFYGENLLPLTQFGGGVASSLTLVDAGRRVDEPQGRTSAEHIGSELEKDSTLAASDLQRLWSDGLILEDEIVPLTNVLARFDKILGMRDEGVLAMLDRSVADKVKAAFSDVEALADAARTQLSKINKEVGDRDEVALRDKLDLERSAPSYVSVSASESTVSPQRYKPGDYVALGGTPPKHGIVVAQQDEDVLRVETLGYDKRLEIRHLSKNELLEHNPLKIGDAIELDGSQYCIKPSTKAGGIEVVQVDGIQLTPIPIEELRSRLGAVEPTKPLVDTAPTILAGTSKFVVSKGEETSAPVALGELSLVEGAVFSHRGPTASANEDAAALEVKRGKNGAVVVLAVADQASGGRPNGPASDAAVQAMLELGALAAESKSPATTFKKKLSDQLRKANDAAGPDATSLTGAILVPSERGMEAQVLQVGSTLAWHYSAKGNLKNQTQEHTMGRYASDMSGDPNNKPTLTPTLTRAIGAGWDSTPDKATWSLDGGDYLLLVTSGGSHANVKAQVSDPSFSMFNTDLTARQVGARLEGAETIEEAAERIRQYVDEKHEAGDARAGNFSFVLVQVPTASS